MAMYNMGVGDLKITQGLEDTLGIKTVAVRCEGSYTFYVGWRGTPVKDEEVSEFALKKLRIKGTFDILYHRGFRIYDLFNRYKDITLAFKRSVYDEGYFYFYTYNDGAYKFMKFSEIEDCLKLANIDRKISYVNTFTYVRVFKYLFEILKTTKILSLVAISYIYWLFLDFLSKYISEFNFLNKIVATPFGSFSWFNILLVFGVLSAVLARVEYNLFEARSVRSTLRANLRAIRVNRYAKLLETFKEINPFKPFEDSGEGFGGGMF